jgi:hypothetical protein
MSESEKKKYISISAKKNNKLKKGNSKTCNITPAKAKPKAKPKVSNADTKKDAPKIKESVNGITKGKDLSGNITVTSRRNMRGGRQS